MAKNNWSGAYKQIRVSNKEIWQQGFRWLGNVFFELCLVVGAISSPGLFDRIAKIILWIALVRSCMPKRCVTQHIDDVCVASPATSTAVHRFYSTYRKVCEEVRVELADTDDPDKGFAPST